MKGILFLFFFISSSVFALHGGKIIARGEFPAVVALHLNDVEFPEYDFFCSGVLVAPNKVLTAGHCIAGLGGQVYDDVHRLPYFSHLVTVKSQGKTIRAKNIIMAPNYFEAPGLESEDLALIELEEALFSVQPLQLISTWELEKGMSLTMVARGKTAETTLTNVIYHPIPLVLLTDTSKSAACRGDSGGALLAKKNGQWKLAGILISEGEEECNFERNYSFFPKVRF